MRSNAAVKIRDEVARAPLAYRARNLRNRALPRHLKAEALRLLKVGITTELSAILIRADGSVVNLGVLSRRVVTDAGVQFIANAFLNTAEAENMNYSGSGTGVNAEAVGDVALQTEVGTRASGTQTSPSNGAYRSVATQTYAAGFAITEHGLFSASTNGTLLDRSKFAAINVQNLDSIQWTYTITFNSGG